MANAGCSGFGMTSACSGIAQAELVDALSPRVLGGEDDRGDAVEARLGRPHEALASRSPSFVRIARHSWTTATIGTSGATCA